MDLFSHRKEWDGVLCVIMGGSGDHDAKINQLHTQILHNVDYVGFKNHDLMEVEGTWWLLEAGGQREAEQ